MVATDWKAESKICVGRCPYCNHRIGRIPQVNEDHFRRGWAQRLDCICVGSPPGSCMAIHFIDEDGTILESLHPINDREEWEANYY